MCRPADPTYIVHLTKTCHLVVQKVSRSWLSPIQLVAHLVFRPDDCTPPQPPTSHAGRCIFATGRPMRRCAINLHSVSQSPHGHNEAARCSLRSPNWIWDVARRTEREGKGKEGQETSFHTRIIIIFPTSVPALVTSTCNYYCKPEDLWEDLQQPYGNKKKTTPLLTICV